MKDNKYWFFGSKLNTLLLLILIILMIIALKFMWANKEYYKENLGLNAPEIEQVQKKDTYTYTNHGFSIELPKGYVPHELESETGPSMSIELPPKAWLIYISNATWWEKNNITGQAAYLNDEKIGTTVFKVYRYNNAEENDNFYLFKQGNVAYAFNGDARQYMETFKFVGWSESSVTTTWQTKTFGDESGEITFKYPANWKSFFLTEPRPGAEQFAGFWITSNDKVANASNRDLSQSIAFSSNRQGLCDGVSNDPNHTSGITKCFEKNGVVIATKSIDQNMQNIFDTIVSTVK